MGETIATVLKLTRLRSRGERIASAGGGGVWYGNGFEFITSLQQQYNSNITLMNNCGCVYCCACYVHARTRTSAEVYLYPGIRLRTDTCKDNSRVGNLLTAVAVTNRKYLVAVIFIIMWNIKVRYDYAVRNANIVFYHR